MDAGRSAGDARHRARAALVEEAIQAFLNGDLDEGRTLLRDCINATVGFAKLSELTHTPAKSLMRMVGPNGNPSAGNLLSVLRAVQRGAGVHARVEVSGVPESELLTAE